MKNRFSRRLLFVTLSTVCLIAGPAAADNLLPSSSRIIDDTIAVLREAESHGLAAREADIAVMIAASRHSDSEDVVALVKSTLTDFALDFEFGQRKPSRTEVNDVRARVRDAVSEQRVTDWYKQLMPTDPAYHRLRAALRLLQFREGNGAWEPIGPGATLEPGDATPRVRRLRNRLGLDTTDDKATVYDKQVQQAVLAYQALNGLDADGLVGKRTRYHLDTGTDQRIGQVKTNLQRWRSGKWSTSGKHVQVNLPSYELSLVDSDGISDQMRIIIGDTDNQTPLFQNDIEYLVFSPYWYVPRRIALEEILPELRRSRRYLARKKFDAIDLRNNQLVSVLDWARIDAGEFPYRLRQRPGPGNALGRVKFIFPNSQNIYLHDTSSPQLFSSSRRAYSHGCIRVEDPQRLAEWLLDDQPGWTEQAVRTAMASNAPNRVEMQKPVPIIASYFTAIAHESGQISYYDDVYEQDTNHSGMMASEYFPDIRESLSETLQVRSD